MAHPVRIPPPSKWFGTATSISGWDGWQNCGTQRTGPQQMACHTKRRYHGSLIQGDRKTLGNYRGICLLPMASRIIAGVLATRLRTWSEKPDLIGDTQHGFRANRSTAHAAQIIVRTHEELQGSISTNIPETTLLDITKAYPRVNKTILWAMLEKLGMKTPTLRLHKGLHKHKIWKSRQRYNQQPMETRERPARRRCNIAGPLQYIPCTSHE